MVDGIRRLKTDFLFLFRNVTVSSRAVVSTGNGGKKTQNPGEIATNFWFHQMLKLINSIGTVTRWRHMKWWGTSFFYTLLSVCSGTLFSGTCSGIVDGSRRLVRHNFVFTPNTSFRHIRPITSPRMAMPIEAEKSKGHQLESVRRMIETNLSEWSSCRGLTIPLSWTVRPHHW